MLETAVTEIPQSSDGWIEALPARVYTTPQYGEIPVTTDKLERMISNFTNNVRGQEIATDFEHGRDTAKGLQASGWYKEFKIDKSSDDPGQVSLWAKVDFTDDAKKEIQDGKWKYWSLEWDDEYVDDKGELIPDVILGGGLTNRPVAKRTMPINFSEAMWEELDEDTQREFAVWTTKYINSLPNSAFLYVEAGAATDKSKRHLPYKDASGKIDLPHLRNAIARIPQMKGISAELKARLQAKARRLLGGSQKATSEGMPDGVFEAFELLHSVGFDVGYEMGEHKEEEHAEPGLSNPPPPRKDESGEDDLAIVGGWRRDPLPTPLNDPNIEGVEGKPPNTNMSETGKEDGGRMDGITLSPAQVSQLYSLLGITMPDTPGDEFFEPAKVAFSEWKALRDAVDASSEEKEFAEKYPQYWGEHSKLMERDRDNTARMFAESVSRIRKSEGYGLKETKQELSPQAKDKLIEVHKKFAEGTATAEDFENCIKEITNGGIVMMGELGSSGDDDVIPEIDTTTAPGVAAARKLFAEVVDKVQAEHDDWAYMKCVDEAAKKYPDLAENYRVALPA